MRQELSPMQQRVFRLLHVVPDCDVPISSIYKAAYPDAAAFADETASVAARYMQQAIGPVIQRINEKLDGGRIRPGDLKRTYRYDTSV